MSREFDIANQEVRFFLNDTGNVQVGSFHPRKSTVGALGIDSRRFSMLSRIDGEEMRLTLQRELSDSIVQAILRTGVDVEGRLVGQTPVVELFQLAATFPAFFDKYPTFGDIPKQYLDEVRHTIPVHFYCNDQVIHNIGPDDIRELDDGLVEVAVPIEIEPHIHKMEFELNGKDVSYSFEIPGISGVVYLVDKMEKFQGKPAEFSGLTLKVPGFPDAVITDQHLARLCLIGEADFDFTLDDIDE